MLSYMYSLFFCIKKRDSKTNIDDIIVNIHKCPKCEMRKRLYCSSCGRRLPITDTLHPNNKRITSPFQTVKKGSVEDIETFLKEQFYK